MRPRRAEPARGPIPAPGARHRRLDLAGGLRAGELEPLGLGFEGRHAGDLANLGPVDIAAGKGAVDGGEILDTFRREDQPVGILDAELFCGPAGRALKSGPELAASLHVEEVEAERTLGDLSLAVVEAELLDKLIFGEPADEPDGVVHVCPPW